MRASLAFPPSSDSAAAAGARSHCQGGQAGVLVAGRDDPRPGHRAIRAWRSSGFPRPGQPVEPDRPIERANRDLKLRAEFVQVPAQPLLGSCPLRNKVVAESLANRRGERRKDQSPSLHRGPK
jgi:hypothetical protein